MLYITVTSRSRSLPLGLSITPYLFLQLDSSMSGIGIFDDRFRTGVEAKLFVYCRATSLSPYISVLITDAGTLSWLPVTLSVTTVQSRQTSFSLASVAVLACSYPVDVNQCRRRSCCPYR